MKNVLATVGILTVVVGVAVWQFGFLSQKAKEASKKIDRATAVARAEKALSDARTASDELSERARNCRVKAATLEIGWKRDQEQIDVKKEALRRLAQAAKAAGLPAPSDRASMTEEERAKTLTFGGKTISAPDVYSTIERWNAEIKSSQVAADATRKRIDGLRNASVQILEKQKKMNDVSAQIETRLGELSVAKDLAQIDKELAELEAGVGGLDVGKVGQALDVLQDEIDELTATATVYNEEAQTPQTGLTPEDVVAPAVVENELDALWDAAPEAPKAEKTETKSETNDK